MKKILAVGVAALYALGVANSSFATEDTPVVAQYNVEAAYSVTIPSQITFSKANTSVDVEVGITDVLIAENEAIKVSMSSANGNLTNGTSYIPYSFTLNSTEVTIAANTDYHILSVPSQNPEGITKNITFTAGSLDHVTISGLHTDTLTFRVALDDGTPYMQDIDASIKTSISNGTITALKDERNDNVYNVAKIGDTIWMTQDLDYTPAESTWSEDGIKKVGGTTYYNWTAANAVCPSGWTLPSKNQVDALKSAHDLESIAEAPFYGKKHGLYDGSPIYISDSYGYYWSSQVNPDNTDQAYNLVISPYILSTDYTAKTNGYPVRCVAE